MNFGSPLVTRKSRSYVRVVRASGLLVAVAVAGLCAQAVPSAEAHTLSYSKAKRAAQSKGDALAGKRTRVNSLLRMSKHKYYTQVRWTQTDPTGCKGCKYNEDTMELEDGPSTESCFAEINVVFRSARSSRTVRAGAEQVLLLADGRSDPRSSVVRRLRTVQGPS